LPGFDREDGGQDEQDLRYFGRTGIAIAPSSFPEPKERPDAIRRGVPVDSGSGDVRDELLPLLAAGNGFDAFQAREHDR